LGQQPNSWKYVGLLLVVVHFFIPFLLLLLRWTKRQFARLTQLAILMLFLRMIDVYWLAGPSSLQLEPGLHISWMDFLTPIGIGGIWLAAFSWLLEGLPMLPHIEPADEEYEPENSTGEARATGSY
jgi:hypothetical protein